MVNIFQDVWRLENFCFLLFLTCIIVNTVSNNMSSKCDRRAYYAVHSSLKCEAEGEYDSRTSVEAMKPDMRLPRIDPIKVGFTRTVKYEDRTYVLKTLSLRPPIFEIKDFLSSEECDSIVEMAKTDGMGISKTVWSETDEVLTDGNLRAVFDKLDVNSDSSLDYYEVSVIVN